MRRGFKSQAERLAYQRRFAFGLSPLERLDPIRFLQSAGIIVWTPAEIPGMDPVHIEQLTVNDPDSWSGVTIREGNDIAIVVNPAHPTTRRANTLMHEWAHIELRHKPNRVDRSESGLLLLSDYPAEVEEEADWFAGAMLLPRDGLVYYRVRAWGTDSIARHYGVSTELANWRLRMTGVEKQLRNRN